MSRSETGGPPWVVEGERGTFKFAIIIDYAFSLSLAHARQLPPGRSLGETESRQMRATGNLTKLLKFLNFVKELDNYAAGRYNI